MYPYKASVKLITDTEQPKGKERLRDLPMFAWKFCERSRLTALKPNAIVLTPNHPSTIRCRLLFSMWTPLSDKLLSDFPAIYRQQYILEFGCCIFYFKWWEQVDVIDLSVPPLHRLLPSCSFLRYIPPSTESQHGPLHCLKLLPVPLFSLWYCSSQSLSLLCPHLTVCFLLDSWITWAPTAETPKALCLLSLC